MPSNTDRAHHLAQGPNVFLQAYAALRLVTSYAAPWLRHVRVSLGSLQTWWSGRAANGHAGSNHALRSTVDSRQPVCGDYSATVRFIKTPARFTCERHGLCSSVSGWLQVDKACVVVDVLADVRSDVGGSAIATGCAALL